MRRATRRALPLRPIALLCVALLAAPARSDVELPAVFGTHMVLQRDQEIPVWGRAAPGEAVSVSFAGETAQTTADAEGRWRVDLPALAASAEPRTMTVRGANTIVYEDVLVGEVWVCSGQSNMEWSVAASKDAQQEIASAQESRIRHIKAERTLKNTEQFTVPGQWQVCSPETVGQFTAVGYFFGRELCRTLDVPVGLLNISWGGSRAEPWTSPEALAGHPRYAELMEQQAAEVEAWGRRSPEQLEAELAEARRRYRQAVQDYWPRATQDDPGSKEHWERPDLEDGSWPTMDLPRLWRDHDDEALKAHDGFAWFRRVVDIPADWAGQELTLSLGAIDDADQTFFQGRRVGDTIQDHQARRRYTVPGDLVQAGPAVLTVQVLDTGGAGGLNGPKDALWIAPSKQLDQRRSLAGAWRYRRGGDAGKASPAPTKPAPPPEPGTSFTSPAAMYRGMLHPFLPCAMRGAIWYQGESNAGQAEAYRELLPLMIQSWRTAWGRSFPFGIVQLASFMAPALDQPAQGGWAELRDAQLFTWQTVPDTGMVVLSDIGEANDIHPRNKQEVGRRLSLWALATVYGRDREYSGPVMREVRAGQGALTVVFDHAGGGLDTADGQPPRGFAIAGRDGNFVWAEARVEGDTVVLSSPEVKEPVAVRYGWHNNLEHLNLVNPAGLPATPFRWDG